MRQLLKRNNCQKTKTKCQNEKDGRVRFLCEWADYIGYVELTNYTKHGCSHRTCYGTWEKRECSAKSQIPATIRSNPTIKKRTCGYSRSW